MRSYRHVTVVIPEGISVPENLSSLLSRKGLSIQGSPVASDLKRYLDSNDKVQVLWISDNITDEWEIVPDRTLRKHGVFRLQSARPFNVATLLTRVPDAKYLEIGIEEEWMRWVYHMGSEGDPSPVVLDHTVAKWMSSYPYLYLRGEFFPDYERKGHRERVVVDQKKMLLEVPPNREGIDITREYMRKHIPQTLDEMIPIHSAVSALKNEGPASLAKRRGGGPPKAIAAYLEIIDQQNSLALSALARLIIARTQYITHTTLMESITRALTSFLEEASRVDKEKPLYLYIGDPGKTVGSEHWLIALLLPHLLKYNKRRSILLLTQEGIPKLLDESEGKLQIFMIDDLIHSGYHLAFTLETLWMEETKKRIEMTVIVAGTTSEGRGLIESFSSDSPIYEKVSVLSGGIAVPTTREIIEASLPLLESVIDAPSLKVIL